VVVSGRSAHSLIVFTKGIKGFNNLTVFAVPSAGYSGIYTGINSHGNHRVKNDKWQWWKA
jgi:hypothetical protein